MYCTVLHSLKPAIAEKLGEFSSNVRAKTVLMNGNAVCKTWKKLSAAEKQPISVQSSILLSSAVYTIELAICLLIWTCLPCTWTKNYYTVKPFWGPSNSSPRNPARFLLFLFVWSLTFPSRSFLIVFPNPFSVFLLFFVSPKKEK